MKFVLHWLTPVASGIFLCTVAQTALGQEAVADAAEWSEYCIPERSGDGACYIGAPISCTGEPETASESFQGSCSVGDDPPFQENNWPAFLCDDYQAGSDECSPINAQVTCYSQQGFGADVCTVGTFDAGGAINRPVFTVGGFVVPISEGGWFGVILWVVGIGVVGFGILAVIGAFLGDSKTVGADPPPPPNLPKQRNRPDEIDRLRPEDLKVSARVENWHVADEIEVRIARPTEGG